MLRNISRYRCLADVETWPKPIQFEGGDDIRDFYERRMSAFIQYKAGATHEAIQASTGLTRQLLRYWLCRCSTLDPNGKVIGSDALVSGKHLAIARKYNPKLLQAAKPLPGVLGALLVKHPTIETILRNAILHGIHPGSKRKDSRLTWDVIHAIFLDACTADGIKPPDYPFNGPRQGREAVIQWGKKINRIEGHRKQLAEEMAKASDPWYKDSPALSGCYRDCSVDGHYLDIRLRIIYQSLNGTGESEIECVRVWLIAIIEEKSGAILGYSIALGQNYSAADMTRALRSALVPWKPRSLTVSTVAYKPGECLPSGLSPELEFVTFDRLKLDNAMAHSAGAFLCSLDQTVQAVPVFGARASPNDRPQMERLFGLLEEAGIHGLDGTTGSKPTDIRRDNSKSNIYKLSIDLLEDLIELLVVRYNTSLCPGSTQSHLEVLAHHINRTPNLIRYVSPKRREHLLEYDLYDEATLGTNGRDCILRWKDARYYNRKALADPALVGKEVLVMCNSQDARVVRVILIEDGRALGDLMVERRWRASRHSLQTRAYITKCKANGSFSSNSTDLPRAFRQHLEGAAKEERGNQRMLLRLQREQEEDAKLQDESDDEINLTPAGNSTPYPSKPLTNDVFYDEPDEILAKLGSTFRAGR